MKAPSSILVNGKLPREEYFLDSSCDSFILKVSKDAHPFYIGSLMIFQELALDQLPSTPVWQHFAEDDNKKDSKNF